MAAYMIVVLTGPNVYMLHKYLQEYIADFKKKHNDSVERFDATELTNLDRVLDAVRSISFLEPRKLVIVRDFSQNSSMSDVVEDIVEQTADTTDLLLIDSKLDKRTSMYKYLKKTCDMKIFELLNPNETERWLAAEAQQMNVNIQNSDVRFLVDRVGANQQLLSQELHKIANRSTDITKDIIEEMVEPTPQSKVFDMLEALFSGNAQRAYNLYEDQRSQGAEPQQLLAMITWQLQQLTLAVYAPVKNQNELISAGMSPYSAQKALQLAKKLSKKDMQFFITELAEIDRQSKTSADIESALAVYFSEVTEKINTTN